LGPLKLAQLKPEFGTAHPSSRKSFTIRRTGRVWRGEQNIESSLPINYKYRRRKETFHGFLREIEGEGKRRPNI
jgi:hypothetical protein